nr:hypothetical protein [Vibrio splendidus]MCC4883009.1 hypothetical protein [Vibrio splendidus]
MNNHHFSYVNITKDGKKTWSFDRVNQRTFQNGNHPLFSLCEQALDIFGYQSQDHISINPSANALRIVNLMMHDTYNNGTGNACYWNKSKEFKKTIRKAGYDKETINHLERLYRNLFDNMMRGRNFGWVRDGSLNCLMESLEILQTDLTYLTAKQMFPSELERLERELPQPYAL